MSVSAVVVAVNRGGIYKYMMLPKYIEPAYEEYRTIVNLDCKYVYVFLEK